MDVQVDYLLTEELIAKKGEICGTFLQALSPFSCVSFPPTIFSLSLFLSLSLSLVYTHPSAYTILTNSIACPWTHNMFCTTRYVNRYELFAQASLPQDKWWPFVHCVRIPGLLIVQHDRRACGRRFGLRRGRRWRERIKRWLWVRGRTRLRPWRRWFGEWPFHDG